MLDSLAHGEGFFGILVPDSQAVLDEIAFVVFASSSEKLALVTLVSLISVFLEVAAAPLPSLVLRTPLRAAWTIWS